MARALSVFEKLTGLLEICFWDKVEGNIMRLDVEEVVRTRLSIYSVHGIFAIIS
jgi:hypothetical protein